MYQFLFFFVSHFICLFYFQTFIDTLVWLKYFFLVATFEKDFFLQSNNFNINILCSVINPLKKQHFVAIWQRMRLNVKQNVYRYKLGVIDGTCMVTSAIQFISMTYLKKLFLQTMISKYVVPSSSGQNDLVHFLQTQQQSN